LDGRREWYRYHHLFRELLQMDLERTEPELVPVLHQRAAAWHRAQGSVDAAIQHSLAAGDSSFAGKVILENWSHFQRTGGRATVEGWLARLPESAFAASTSLALAAAFFTVSSGPVAEVERYLSFARDSEVDGPLPEGAHSVRSAAALARSAAPHDDVSLAL